MSGLVVALVMAVVWAVLYGAGLAITRAWVRSAVPDPELNDLPLPVVAHALVMGAATTLTVGLAALIGAVA